MDEVVGVLGVVLGEEAVGGEGVVDPVAQGVAQLGLGHAAVERQGGDQHHVVHPGGRRQVEHLLDDELADVGGLHRGQREGDVVEADGEAHARAEQGRQRRRVAERVLEGVADGGHGSASGSRGSGGVDRPGCPRAGARG